MKPKDKETKYKFTKTLLILISSLMIVSFTATAQNDSIYQLNLRLYINDCDAAKADNESLKRQVINDSSIIAKQDMDIKKADTTINNQKIQIGNLEIDKQWLKSEILKLKVEAESKWGLLEYGGVGVLLIIIGILGGMQL